MAMKEVYGIKKVIKAGEEKSFWTRIGVAHECKDGSLNVYLDYAPLHPEIGLNIRDKKEKETKGETNGNDHDAIGNNDGF